MSTPYGTIHIQRGKDVVELPLPSDGDVTFGHDGIVIDDPLGTWTLTEDDAGDLTWEHHPSAWVARISRINDLRAEVLAFLDHIGDIVARDLAARIRKEHW